MALWLLAIGLVSMPNGCQTISVHGRLQVGDVWKSYPGSWRLACLLQDVVAAGKETYMAVLQPLGGDSRCQ